MKLEFKSDDFLSIRHASDFEREMMADAANAALERMLSQCQIVCGAYANNDWVFTYKTSAYDTHKAILVNIEAIEKPKCEHVFGDTYFEVGNGVYKKCIVCGVKLVPKWEEVK